LPGLATSAITGVVSNENGAALPGAIVTLTSEASGDVLSQLTSEEGEFRFDGLAARTYIVECQAKNYESVKHHGFVLKQGEARRLDVGMEKMIVMSGAVYIPAQPLRVLYLNSDRVVIAEVGKSINAVREGSSRILRTSLGVSQTIKGDGHKSVIVVDEWVYGRDRGSLVEGETALLFLQRKEDARGANDIYELSDNHSSAKHLSSSDLATYLQRIEELKVILGNSDSNPSDITEWLVRCAEDPATRREGVFELKMSAWREQFEKQVAERMTADREISPSKPKARKPEPLFAALLTSEQRQRLINMLLNTEDLALDGNSDLIELVRQWNDPRLAPFLISYLKRFGETAPESLSRVMQTVAGLAELLDDPKITALLRQYHDNATFEDLEAEEAEGADSDEDDDADSNEGEVADPDEADKANEDETANARDEVDTASMLTPEAARQVRVEILKRFLDAVDSKLRLSQEKQKSSA